MSDTTLSRVSLFLLRNVVPRQGTEMWLNSAVLFTKSIEKCSSPTGDGNFKADVDNAITVNKELRNVVPRQGTEIRQGKTYTMVTLIEKCSSPTGDGNATSNGVTSSFCTH